MSSSITAMDESDSDMEKSGMENNTFKPATVGGIIQAGVETRNTMRLARKLMAYAGIDKETIDNGGSQIGRDFGLGTLNRLLEAVNNVGKVVIGGGAVVAAHPVAAGVVVVGGGVIYGAKRCYEHEYPSKAKTTKRSLRTCLDEYAGERHGVTGLPTKCEKIATSFAMMGPKEDAKGIEIREAYNRLHPAKQPELKKSFNFDLFFNV